MAHVVVTIELRGTAKADFALPMDVETYKLATALAEKIFYPYHANPLNDLGDPSNPIANKQARQYGFEIIKSKPFRLPPTTTLGNLLVTHGLYMRLYRLEQPVHTNVPLTSSATKAWLQYLRGNSIFPITKGVTLIGRGDPHRGIIPDIDLTPLDAEHMVSRQHAQIIYQQGQYYIMDLNSKNGTFIDNQLIPPMVKVPLKTKASISFGPGLVFFFSADQ